MNQVTEFLRRHNRDVLAFGSCAVLAVVLLINEDKQRPVALRSGPTQAQIEASHQAGARQAKIQALLQANGIAAGKIVLAKAKSDEAKISGFAPPDQPKYWTLTYDARSPGNLYQVSASMKREGKHLNPMTTDNVTIIDTRNYLGTKVTEVTISNNLPNGQPGVWGGSDIETQWQLPSYSVSTAGGAPSSTQAIESAQAISDEAIKLARGVRSAQLING